MTASNHFLAALNAILGIKMYANAKKLTASDIWPPAKFLIKNLCALTKFITK